MHERRELKIENWFGAGGAGGMNPCLLNGMPDGQGEWGDLRYGRWKYTHYSVFCKNIMTEYNI